MENQAERLYKTVADTLKEVSFVKLLMAAGDARARLLWEKVHPETRDVFLRLAVNLTPPTPKL